MKTAVEWLFEQIPSEWSSSRAAFEAFEQAKEMEKEHIVNAYLKKRKRTDLLGALKKIDEAEQYYNETFKSE